MEERAPQLQAGARAGGTGAVLYGSEAFYSCWAGSGQALHLFLSPWAVLLPAGTTSPLSLR